uniref:Cilia- and flagella-associated protein 52 n=1 Tax=Melopsittacus undulatus TaxID=13146 RepID=A0A8V5HHI5_MELUD
CDNERASDLSLLSLIGHVPFGLICHPNKQHILYPLGCTVVVQDLDSKKQVFLHGHTNNVSCVVVSRDGVYVASGEVAFMGFTADIILWHFQRKELLARLSLHKGRVEGLAFSPNNLYLISLGGQDDGSVVVWHVDQREAICGSPASAQNSGNATVVVCSSCRDEMFVTAGNNTIRVWELDLPNRKIRPAECRTGHLRRVVTCVKMADDDSYFYIGTSSGDVLKMNTNNKLMTDFGPQKKMFSLGVTTLVLLKTGNSIVGTGEGIVALCKGSDYRVMKKIQVQGGVTSLTCRGQGHQFFIGTNKCQIYRVNYTEFKEELIAACHNEAVHDIVFPFLGVTAIAATNDCKWIISGGGEGQVRVWEIREMTQKLVEVLKEHVSAVSCIKVKKDDRECVTASLDGTCIIWDIVRFVRKQMFLANTLFKCVCYHPEEYQVITSGTDRKIGYWEVFDGSVIREVEGSASGSINGMDITSDGAFFVTGGDDHLVKLWDYKGGAVTHVGVGHSGNITRLKICPGKKNIVSVSADGAILIWKYPDLH